MAISSYADEAALAGYMHRVLGRDELAQALDWSVARDDYQDAVDETLLVMDVTDVSTVTATTDLRKLRAVARAEVWRLVMSRTAGDYDVSLDGDSYKRAQLHKHAAAMFNQAKAEAVALGADDYAQQQKPSSIATTVSRRGIDTT